MFAAICFNRFVSHVRHTYVYALEQTKLHTSRKRRYHVDEVLLIQIYVGSLYLPFYIGHC
jgi:hypothetical protein